MKKLLILAGLALTVFLGVKFPYPPTIPHVPTTAEIDNQISSKLSVLSSPSQQPMVGATIPVVVSVFETSLASKITSAATSMTLVSGTDSAGTSLAGFICFTLDEGTATAEFVCGTAAGTAITSMTRGISPITGTSTVVALEFEHRRGASVKITNYPQLAIVSRILNGNETVPNPMKYDSAVSTTTLQSNGLYLADVAYVNGVALVGAPNATTTTQGVVQFATGAQLSAGTIQGSTGAFLVPANNFFSSTFRSSTTVPVTSAAGVLSSSFIDQTASYVWSGTGTFSGAVTFSSATTTLSATTSIASSASNKLFLNTVGYAFPSSQGTASTSLVNDGSGNLKWTPTFFFANSTSTATSSAWASLSASTTLTSITYTPPVASRLMINVVLSANSSNQGGGCRSVLYIDNASTTSASFYGAFTGGGNGNLGFTYITSQQSAAQHTYTLAGLAMIAGSCTITDGPQMSIINIGN